MTPMKLYRHSITNRSRQPVARKWGVTNSTNSKAAEPHFELSTAWPKYSGNKAICMGRFRELCTLHNF